MSTFKQILMNRDGMTEEQAQVEFDSFKRFVDEAIMSTPHDTLSAMEKVEDRMLSDYNLEPDFIDEFIY